MRTHAFGTLVGPELFHLASGPIVEVPVDISLVIVHQTSLVLKLPHGACVALNVRGKKKS